MLGINSKELLSSLSFVDSGTSGKSVARLYEQVLLKVENGALTARAFNTIAHTAARVCDAPEESEGELVIDLKRTIANLKSLGDTEVSVTIDWDAPSVTFKSGRTKWIEHCSIGEAFPMWPRGLPETKAFEKELSLAVKAAESQLDSRVMNPAMKGVHLASGEGLEVVGMDGYSMSVYRMDNPIPDFSGNVTVPMESVALIRSVFEKGNAEIGVSKHWVVARSGDHYVASQTLSERYPDYGPILIDMGEVSATILAPRADLLRAISQSASFTDLETRAMALEIHEQDGERLMTVRGEGQLVSGKAVVDVPVITDLVDVTIRVDHNRLSSAIRDFSGSDEVMIALDPPEEARRMAVKSASNDTDHFVQVALMRPEM